MAISKKVQAKMLENGYTNEDILFIEDNTKNVRCSLCNDNDDDFEEKITHIKAKELIGEYNFATAIYRALHHNSSVRDIEGSELFIYFEKKGC